MTGGFAYTTLYERKVLARMQVRIVPTGRAFWVFATGGRWHQADLQRGTDSSQCGPADLHSGACDHRPAGADHHGSHPWALPLICLDRYSLHLADINVAVLLHPVRDLHFGIRHHPGRLVLKQQICHPGWLRSTAQMISYELSLGLAFVGRS